MVIYEDHHYQTSSQYPDTNFISEDDTEQPRWIVPDNTELAKRIKTTCEWEPIEDDDGNLIDIIEIPCTISENETDQQRAEEIKQQLVELDNQTIRPLRATLAGTATDEDRDKLIEIEQQAAKLREELNEITS